MIKRGIEGFKNFIQIEYLVDDSVDEDYVIRECTSRAGQRPKICKSFAYSLSGSACFHQVHGDAKKLFDEIEEERVNSLMEEL